MDNEEICVSLSENNLAINRNCVLKKTIVNIEFVCEKYCDLEKFVIMQLLLELSHEMSDVPSEEQVSVTQIQ